MRVLEGGSRYDTFILVIIHELVKAHTKKYEKYMKHKIKHMIIEISYDSFKHQQQRA